MKMHKAPKPATVDLTFKAKGISQSSIRKYQLDTKAPVYILEQGIDTAIMSSSIPSDLKKFKIALMPMALFLAVTGGVLGIFFVVLKDGTFPFHAFLLNLETLGVGIGSIFVLFAYAELVSILSPVRLSSDGIYGHSFWGTKRFVHWQDVGAVKPIRILNLRFLRFYSTANNKVTWLPLFQARKAEFRQEIQRLAPRDNQVLNHFR